MLRHSVSRFPAFETSRGQLNSAFSCYQWDENENTSFFWVRIEPANGRDCIKKHIYFIYLISIDASIVKLVSVWLSILGGVNYIYCPNNALVRQCVALVNTYNAKHRYKISHLSKLFAIIEVIVQLFYDFKQIVLFKFRSTLAFCNNTDIATGL